MLISDWNSDVCSSDLQYIARRSALLDAPLGVVEGRNRAGEGRAAPSCELSGKGGPILPEDGLALRGDSAFDRLSGFHLGAKLGQQVKAAEPAPDQGDSSDTVQRGIGDLPLRLAGLAAKNGVDQSAQVALAKRSEIGRAHV